MNGGWGYFSCFYLGGIWVSGSRTQSGDSLRLWSCTESAQTLAQLLRSSATNRRSRGVQNLHHLHVQRRRKRIFNRLVVANAVNEVGDGIARLSRPGVDRDTLPFQCDLAAIIIRGSMKQLLPGCQKTPLWTEHLHLSVVIRPIPRCLDDHGRIGIFEDNRGVIIHLVVLIGL